AGAPVTDGRRRRGAVAVLVLRARVAARAARHPRVAHYQGRREPGRAAGLAALGRDVPGRGDRRGLVEGSLLVRGLDDPIHEREALATGHGRKLPPQHAASLVLSSVRVVDDDEAVDARDTAVQPRIFQADILRHADEFGVDLDG